MNILKIISTFKQYLAQKKSIQLVLLKLKISLFVGKKLLNVVCVWFWTEEGGDAVVAIVCLCSMNQIHDPWFKREGW